MTCLQGPAEVPPAGWSGYGFGSPEIASAAGWPVVLYFHRIVPSPTSYTEISTQSFDTILSIMSNHFRPLDLHLLSADVVVTDAGLAALESEEPRFVVTLDDGYLDNAVLAAPILERRGLQAVFFVVTDRVGEEDRMSWKLLSRLSERGHHIGSHSATHTPFSKLGPSTIAEELNRSFEAILRETGHRTRLFAYPYGRTPAGERMPHCPGTLGFGTVRAPARPWTEARLGVRRTYVPAGRRDLWRDLIQGWRHLG